MELDFEKESGLIPAIVQDALNNEVLMLGFMNREAVARTLQTGLVTFYSRSRKKLWRKGEESGNFQVVREIRLDCDEDTVLLSVEQRGDGAACHVGYESDFFRMLKDGEWQIVDTRLVDPAKYGPNYGHPPKDKKAAG
jgi:phosphoribosyl-AMP cyclohydrolase